MSDKVKVFIVNESIIQSILTDIVTFGALVGAFWFNHEFLGDGIIFQIVLAICFFAGVYNGASSKTRKMTVDEAREYFCKDEAKP